jgi:KDO2-lipid IV(A) lauroyltransferase
LVQEQQSPSDSGGGEVHRRPAREGKKRSRSRPLAASVNAAVLRVAALLPLGALRALGRLGGRVLAAFDTRERQVTRTNVELCWPELDSAARTRLERASLIETGQTIAEFAALWCWRAPRVLALAREVCGAEAFLSARARGGVLLLTPHLGAWEFSGLYVASRVPLTALYKPPPIAEMEAFYTAARQRTGARLVPADASGVRALHRALREGEVAGVLPDQDPGRGSGLFAPFLGPLANTTTLVVKLLEKTGAPLFLCWSERVAGGYRVHFVEASESDLRCGDVARATAAMNRELERLIRSAPEQYLWSYKRFRNRPPGEQDLYRRGGDSEEG